jgi:iron uptake system EfeUOB component EfeO/EfeM
MQKIYISCIILIPFTSCFTRLNFYYVGDKSRPTEKVDVFVDASAIKKEYTIIGKGYSEIIYNWKQKLHSEKILTSAIEKAKQNGADAVFFKETFIYTQGTNINTHGRIDSVGKAVVTASSTTISPTVGYFHNEILFLKYK